MIDPALALIEFDSIAAGFQAADAMIKRAPIQVMRAGTVQPGKFLVLIGGLTADVEESLQAGREIGAPAEVDFVFLPRVDVQVVQAIAGGRVPAPEEALGIIETATVAAAIHAADAGVKGANVRLVEVRLADGLGGKGIVLFSGLVTDVQAAVDIGLGVLERSSQVVRQVVIPQLHEGIWSNLGEATRFRGLVAGKL
jgi:microcompartment protein CcmL/EutN